MAKILGLDLGTNSIGWAVVELVDGTFKLLHKGVHIFQRGYGDEHQDVSRASERTRIRSARKLIYRRKGRKIELLRLLGNEYHPISEEELTLWQKERKYPVRKEIQEWFKLNPYELRVDAIDGKVLSKRELGRVFYHFTQRRGFKSNKKDISSLNENKKDLAKDVEYHQKYLKKYGDKTCSKVLFEKHKNAERIRNTSEQNEISRITLQNDFLLICQKQSLSQEFTEEVRKAIFEARPLKSQKGNVGKCVFEKNKLRCPLSSIEFEDYRMYSFISNIKIKKKGENEKEFKSLYEQNYIDNAVELIKPLFYRQKSSFKFEDIHSRLDKAGLYDFNYKDTTTVSGCPVSAHLKNVFGDSWRTVRFNNGTDKNGKEKYIEIKDVWHMLFDHFMQDKKDEPLLAIAQNKLRLDPKAAEKLINAPIKQGYSNLSYRAIERILNFLKQGYPADKAIILAKIPDILEKCGKTEQLEEIIDEVEKIFKYYSFDRKIANIVNACISVFREDFKNAHPNYLLDEHDKKLVLQNVINFYGENTWSSYPVDEQKKIIENVEIEFEEQLRVGSVGGAFKKTLSIKKQVEDVLVNKFSIDRELASRLYHPSAIEFYPSSEPDENGRRLLRSPMTSSIKNPLFMRAMYELRRVVNELIKQDLVDDDTQIVIETGREVNDYNKRKAIERYQRERETENEFYATILSEFFREKGENRIPTEDDKRKLKFWVEQHELIEESETFYNTLESDSYQYTKKADRIKLPKDAIEKYRLWKEQNGICIYTGNQISISDLFDDNKIDFEHTIPLSKSFDNSMANKTISEAYFNRSIKKNQIPNELDPKYKANINGFIARWETKIEELEDRIEALKRKGKNIQDKEWRNDNIQQRHYLYEHLKYWRKKVNNFKAKEVTDGFKNRQLVDIGITNKYARLYLRSAFNNVFSINAGFIDEYRDILGYKKDRSNHVHHTIDAIFCACSVEFARRKPNAIRILERYYYLNEELRKAVLYAKDLNKPMQRINDELEIIKGELSPWKDFTSQLEQLKEQVVVSHHYKDKFKRQTKKKIRIRGKIVHRAEKIQKSSNGQIKVLEWKYKQDKYGNKIPVKGLINNDNPDFVLHRYKDGNKNGVITEVLRSFDDCSEREDTILLKGYDYVHNKVGEIVYEKEARYTWHNDRAGSSTSGVRDSLNKESLYGRIKRPLQNDKSGVPQDTESKELFEDWYVKRMPVDKLTPANLKNIVDEGIKNRIEQNGGLKNVRSKGEIILPATEKLKEMRIKSIRCRQVKAKGFLTGIPLKENSHLSAKHEFRVKQFGNDYKQMTYVDNDGNYQLGIYSDGKNIRYKFLNNLDAGRLLSESEYPVKVSENEYFIVRGKKIYMELQRVFHANQYVLLLQPGETGNDLNWDSQNQLIQRLYEIKGFGESGNYAVVFCLHNQCAEKVSSLKVKDGIFELDKSTINYRKFLHTNFNALIEDVDFKLDPLGNIKRE